MTNRRTPFVLGTVVGAAAAWLTLAVAARGAGVLPAASAQSAPAKYASTVVFENERVRVKDVTFPPGVLDTGTHTHEFAHVGVILTKGALVFTDPGKPAETVPFEAGSVGYREARATHQVANPGKTPMRVIEVEIK
jgi:mannose-6-phosphate isomerase-like protein (cupin superfamily)